MKITSLILLAAGIITISSCKKDALNKDPGFRLDFSADSVLFDTVFTTIGSSTRNFKVINNGSKKINIESIQLAGGNASAFKINVDGSPGTSFSDLEIAAHDSMYIFVQVFINPNNSNSPLIVSDAIRFTTNGNTQTVILEAWGQDAYYHYPTDAIKFEDGTYFPYSLVSPQKNATVTWPNDKPHVIYGYLVVDSGQKLIVPAGTRVYLNYRAGVWVFQRGEINVLGQKGNEVIFQGARREKDYLDEPGQWDRIWINEGSNNNVIDYAIIKNGFIGVQAEFFGLNDVSFLNEPRRLKITNTRIQNMSSWGLYCLAYNVYAGNNVISNCKEHSLNIMLGGKYTFIHNTFANYWEKEGGRDKPAININNHSDTQVFPLDSCYFGNCVVDGKLGNEILLDIQGSATFPPNYFFSNCMLKTTLDISDPAHFHNLRKDGDLQYEDVSTYYFKPKADENKHRGFIDAKATQDALKFPFDILMTSRNTVSITAGAYE